jgi:acyl carrier protein
MSSLKELQDLIQEKYGTEMAALDPHDSMREKGFDSLALVEFVFAIEDHFSISIPDNDPDLDTLAQLAALVDRIKASQASAAS